MGKEKIKYRKAELNDVSNLAELERKVWGENGASKEMLISRINVFSEGNIIAVYKGNIVGYVGVEYCYNVSKIYFFSWNTVTDDGYIKNSHKKDGKFIYGINLSVDNKMTGYNISLGLTLRVWLLMIKNNKRGVFLGARIPGFRGYKKHNPSIKPDEYIRLLRHGHYRDPELRLYEKDGFYPIKAIPNYFPDPKSENYGALLYSKNPFYNLPFKNLWILFMAVLPFKYRIKISQTKKNDVPI